MEFKRIESTSKLFPFVESFWSLKAHVEDKSYVDFKEYSFFANPFPQIVFQYLGKGFIETSIHHKTDPIPTHHFYGQSSRPIQLATFGSFGVVGVNFYPYAIPHLFDLSSRHTTGVSLELQELFGNRANEIINTVINQSNNSSRIKYLTEVIEGLVHEGGQRDPIIEAAIQFFLVNEGQASIDDLCTHLGYSIRQVERNFKEKIGISPKLYSRIIRFHCAIRKYHRGNFENLSQLALCSGFSDQAHFIREFRQFAGINPRHYFKELDTELSFVRHI